MDFKHWLPTLHPRERIDLTNWLWRSDIQKGAAVSLRSGRSCFSFLLNPILNRRLDRGGAGGDLFHFSATLLAAVFVYVFEELLTYFETLLMGLTGGFTKPEKFIRWDDTSGGLCHRSDTS